MFAKGVVELSITNDASTWTVVRTSVRRLFSPIFKIQHQIREIWPLVQMISAILKCTWLIFMCIKQIHVDPGFWFRLYLWAAVGHMVLCNNNIYTVLGFSGLSDFITWRIAVRVSTLTATIFFRSLSNLANTFIGQRDFKFGTYVALSICLTTRFFIFMDL